MLTAKDPDFLFTEGKMRKKKKANKASCVSLHSPGKHQVKNVKEAVIPIWLKKKKKEISKIF